MNNLKFFTLFIILSVANLVSSGAYAEMDRAALAKEYVNLPANQEMMDGMFSPDSMTANMAAMMAEDDISEDELNALGKIVSEALIEIRPAIMEAMEKRAAEVYTAEELQAMIDFYSTDIGKSIMVKTNEFMQKYSADLAPHMQKMQMSMMPKIMELMSE